jgi:hypothetical protein
LAHAIRERLDLIAVRYPPRQPVDLDALADMISVLVEGGLVLGRALSDGSILPRQVLLPRFHPLGISAARLTD